MKHPGNLLVDAHVHYHPCFPRRLFLRSALDSFQAAAARMGSGPWTPYLMLTESRGEHWFRHCRQEAERREAVDGWRFLATGEEHSLRAVPEGAPDDEPGLVLVAGRQTATREGLEVLGLGRDHDVEDGAGLEETVGAVLEAGALAVIPWGFGKWWGRRGRRVEELLHGGLASEIFLGDNAGRPALAPTPRQFRLAASRGVPILPGSDPLPFRRHADRAGSYGFLLEATVPEAPDPAGDAPDLPAHASRAPAADSGRTPVKDDARGPAAELFQRLRRSPGRPPGRRPAMRTWGERSGLLEFVRDQVAMQVVKRRDGPRTS